ncbi:MAG: RluA family pseudouridine synthase [Burkholderiales bacterium]|nr:RluA family pseudouridine synthase [Phycisphaerae bacterium]
MSEEIDQPEPDAEADLAEDGDLREFKFRLGKNLTRRLDQYLVDRIGYLSRNEIQRLIEDGLVKLNGKPTKSSVKPRENDIVEVSAPPKMIEQLVPEDMPLDVLYEDDYMMALNKQANLVVHPARGVWTGTLVNGLAFYGSKWSSVNGNWRPGILHRLDRNTTGVILIAKADEAHWRLARQFENRTIQKTYVAMCHGIPPLLGDVIDMPIGRDRYIREKQAVRKIESGGRSAVTGYQVQETLETPVGQTVYMFQKSTFANDQHFRTPGGRFSLMKLFPKTGRTHQLRVHLSHIGYPIIGDTMYGGQIVADQADSGFVFSRQALHAHEITFTHPITLNPMTITAPLAPDMVRLWELLTSSRVAN